MQVSTMSSAGSARIGTLRIAPRDLLRVLCDYPHDEPRESGCVTRHWAFDVEGMLATVYDYKYTSAYSKGLPRPSTFWASGDPVEFSIGGYTVDVLPPLGKELTKLAEARGVANISWTVYT